ncbi:MAG: glycosyltransferase family 2 protein, partial [Thermodesulfobacteriota bacterium]|nr:glycosyltransferase family 2 protein [Thermodesulfobacteriota bacterium]
MKRSNYICATLTVSHGKHCNPICLSWKNLIVKAEYFLNNKTEYNVDRIDQPLISVVMPTFQQARSGMLDRALSAVFNQTFKNFELIIIDDGSVDGTDLIIKRWLKKDKRVRLIRHEKNSGLPALRADEGILSARGEYITFAFDDDVWYENALDELYAAIISDHTIDAVYGIDRYYIQQEDGFKLFSDSYGGRDFSIRDIKVSNFIPCNAFLIKKESMIEVGLFAPHILMRRIADWDFWMRAGLRLKIIHGPFLCGEMYEM